MLVEKMFFNARSIENYFGEGPSILSRSYHINTNEALHKQVEASVRSKEGVWSAMAYINDGFVSNSVVKRSRNHILSKIRSIPRGIPFHPHCSIHDVRR